MPLWDPAHKGNFREGGLRHSDCFRGPHRIPPFVSLFFRRAEVLVRFNGL